ncbi:uncharacterized protein VTP21DRAFT_1379 [Calcarisporiella thermophila]|uniref:uncharacterized protein n=1 Tax=Calcarisporiella thermophila TaxID=911321 RepID=UPI003742D47D
MSAAPGGKIIKASEIAAFYSDEVKKLAHSRSVKPKLVGFLANADPAAVKYAEWTGKSCNNVGIEFELRKVDKQELEEEIVKANEDNSVHGIMVYYPVFGDRQDQYLQNVVSVDKDVEGLCHKHVYNMYHNIRFLDEGQTRKGIIPCTPLAIVKILEYIGVYNRVLPYGNRLHGRVITVINRSEIVGRPLAALLANDGAKVFSVDINGVHEYYRGVGIRLSRHEVRETNLTVDEVVPQSDVVITGVPTPNYKLKTSLVRDGTVVINFSSFKNLEEDIATRASIVVPSVGKVTITMLQRNLLTRVLQ